MYARRILFSIVALFLFVSSAGAIDLRVNRKILPNGLVLLHSERHNLPVVKMTMLIKASPLDEPAEKAGLAKLTSSLLDEGTKKMTSTEISSAIEFLGASIGTSTSYDFSTVTLSILKKDLDRGFEIFSDIILNPVFNENDIARVKALILDGLRQSEEDPSFVAEKAFRKEVFPGHPYGRLVSGSPETLNAVTREDLLKFHDAFYVPGNAVLSVVGDITPAELDSLLNKYLSGWTPGPVPKRKLKEPEISGRKTVLVDRDISQANITLGNVGVRRDNPDFYAVSVMNYIFGGGGFAARLMGEIREKLGLVYDVHSFFSSNKERGVFQIEAQTKNQSAKQVVDIMYQEINRIRSAPVSESELKDAKAYMTGSFPRKIDTMSKLADMLSSIEFYGLGLDYINKYPDYVNAVTAEDVLRAAQKYLSPEDVLVIVGKQSETGLKPQ